MKTSLVIFASGTSTGGGTGAENLIKRLPKRTIALVSSHENGGVKRVAEKYGIPFYFFPGPYTEEGYRTLVEKICSDLGVREKDLWYALSGWFHWVYFLSSARTVNIHPAPLPRFGGKEMYGEKLHRRVWDAYQRGEIAEGEINMHFVTQDADAGPIFFRHVFSLRGCESYEEYRGNVRLLEHAHQPFLTELVISGKISWDGIRLESLRVPQFLSQA